MPEINLPRNFMYSSSTAFNAGNIILSYMVHPNDASKRDVFLKLSNLDLKNNLQDVPISKALSEQTPILSQNPELAQALRNNGIEAIVLPFLTLPENAEKFLLGINADNTRNEMFEQKRQKSWSTVYEILLTMIRMERYLPAARGGASVSKAVAFLDKMKKQNVMGNTADMMKAWKDYKSVAHYIMPFFFMYANPDRKECCLYDENGINGFLVLAGNLQDWMLSKKVAHSKQDKLFVKRDLWLIPSWCKYQDFPINVANFSEKELAIIKDYRRL